MSWNTNCMIMKWNWVLLIWIGYVICCEMKVGYQHRKYRFDKLMVQSAG